MKMSSIYKLLILCLLVVFSSEIITAQSGTLTVNEDPKISELLDLKKSLEKENKLTDGYTIQLYYGNLSRANSVIRNYRNRFGEWPATIEYETPNYKVWVGNYTRRIEADRALMEIQKSFPSAFILKPSK
ncbi:MAG: SPOR domain-containing protein [Flavobacteriaceae bacterium]|nr:SPOR domain-containing protein [Flavobacteriaceae bacterium]